MSGTTITPPPPPPPPPVPSSSILSNLQPPHSHFQQFTTQSQQQQPPFPMERVLYNLHHKCCTLALERTSRRSRAWAEHLLLVVAVCGFGALLLLHLTFVHRERPILGVAVVLHNHARSNSSNNSNIPVSCLASIPGFDRDAAVTHLILLVDDEQSQMESRVVRRPATLEGRPSDRVCLGTETEICQQSDSNSFQLSGDILFSYSREKGFLLLSPELTERHGIEAQYVYVSRYDANCFGEPFLQKLSLQLVGPDTVMINWLLGAFQHHNQQGFIYNPRTRAIIDLRQFQSLSTITLSASSSSSSSSSSKNHPQEDHQQANDRSSFFLLRKIRQLMAKTTIIVKTSFLFFITTTLVSRTLHETQGRMLDFTHCLAEYVRTNRSVAPLVTTHVVENLVFVPIMVGMIFFLIEFYRGDKLLAFMVLSLVWVCETFSLVSLRTKQGIHFFPRIFYMLFAIFNFYNFSFPFGFSYSALATSMCFMLHSMLFFWHRYELPAVVLGRVSPEHPRQRAYSSQISTPQIQSPVESGRNSPADTSNNNNIPFLPLAPAGRRSMGRSTSFTSTNGPLSRASSTGGLFHAGGGDDDESVMFFMDGEVVMYRSSGIEEDPSTSRQSSPSLQPSGSTVQLLRSNATRDPTNSNSNNRSAIHEAGTLLANGVSTDEAEDFTVRRTTTSASSLAYNTRLLHAESSEYEADETSALQAILDASREESSSTSSYSPRESIEMPLPHDDADAEGDSLPARPQRSAQLNLPGLGQSPSTSNTGR